MTQLLDMKDNEPCAETVKMLEGMLEQAKAGTLRTVVIICGWSQDGWTTNWAIDQRSSRRRLLGQVSLAQFEILTDTAVHNRDSVLAKTLASMQP